MQYKSLLGGFGGPRRQPVVDKDAKSSRSLEEDGLVATRPFVSRCWARHCERDRRAARAAGEDLMHGVGQLDQHFVLTGRQSDHAIVLMSLASVQCQGRSSTVTCRCPTLGDTLRAAAPNTGTICRFSTQYWISTIASGQLVGKRRVHDQLGRRLVLDGV